jgi:hypothetical protein
MLSVAPVSVLLIAVIGMLVVAFSVARMTTEERRYRGPLTVSRTRTEAPVAPQPASHAHAV